MERVVNLKKEIFGLFLLITGIGIYSNIHATSPLRSPISFQDVEFSDNDRVPLSSKENKFEKGGNTVQANSLRDTLTLYGV